MNTAVNHRGKVGDLSCFIKNEMMFLFFMKNKVIKRLWKIIEGKRQLL